MKTKRLTQALERVEMWSAEWQEQLADIVLDIDAGLKGGVYYPTPEELEGIDRGLREPRPDASRPRRRSKPRSQDLGVNS